MTMDECQQELMRLTKGSYQRELVAAFIDGREKEAAALIARGGWHARSRAGLIRRARIVGLRIRWCHLHSDPGDRRLVADLDFATVDLLSGEILEVPDEIPTGWTAAYGDPAAWVRS